MKNTFDRILGGFVIFQAIAPILMLTLFFAGFVKLAWDIGTAIDTGWKRTSVHIQEANDHIASIKIEGERLMQEVLKIKGAAQQFSGDIGQAIEPLRKSFLGLQSSMRLVAGSVESVINGIVKAVNKIPGVNLNKLRIKRLFNLKAFSLNIPEINLNISPDFSGLEKLAVVSESIATDTQETLSDISISFVFWWSLIKWLFILLVLWAILSMVGYFARIHLRIKKGLQLIRGHSIKQAWQLL